MNNVSNEYIGKIIKFHVKMTQVTGIDKNNITLNTLLT